MTTEKVLMTQKELADAFGKTTATIRRWESEGLIERVKGVGCLYDYAKVKHDLGLDKGSGEYIRELERENLSLRAELKLATDRLEAVKRVLA